ncbi:MAG: energy transducer TonB [Spirochaetaceae bacterium]|nr:energy transducer TonB [Spirochaetaceae bacterium]
MISKSGLKNYVIAVSNSAAAGMARRSASILIAVLAHVLLLFFAVFTIKTVVNPPSESAGIIRLADIREEAPPKPQPVSVPAAVSEPIAAIVVETEDAVSASASVSGETFSEEEDAIDFLPMHLVSQLPRFSEDEIKRKVIYPPIAQRSELEGTVYLEIFVDSSGAVKSVTILKEDPPDRGFGEAAAKAFQGLKGSPALANGKEVAVRYRYPVRFALR